MASGKKSFVLYTDLLSTVEKLKDNEAGKLFKHILKYVNDLNPDIDNKLLEIAFEPIKQQLKRDLKDWEAERSKRSEAGKVGGKKSAEKRLQKKMKQVKQSQAIVEFASSTQQDYVTEEKKHSKNEAIEAKQADNVNVTVNDNVNVNDKRDIYPDFLFPKFEEVEEYFIRQGATKEMAQKFFNKHSANEWRGARRWNFLAQNFIINYQQIQEKNESSKKSDSKNEESGNRSYAGGF